MKSRRSQPASLVPVSCFIFTPVLALMSASTSSATVFNPIFTDR